MNEGKFTFTDRHGREWDTTLTLLSVRRVDNSDFKSVYSGEVSLLQPSEELLRAIVADVRLIAAVVWSVVKPTADERKIDEDGFVDGLDGKSLEAMKEAFWGSLADFFQDRGTGLSELIAIQKRAQSRMASLLKAESEGIGSQVDQMVEREFLKATEQLKGELGTPSSSSSPHAA